jgi:hypothetical protein
VAKKKSVPKQKKEKPEVDPLVEEARDRRKERSERFYIHSTTPRQTNKKLWRSKE